MTFSNKMNRPYKISRVLASFLFMALFCLAIGSTGCSKKTGCPTMEPTDMNKPAKSSSSGLFPDDMGSVYKNKKKRKKKKKKKK